MGKGNPFKYTYKKFKHVERIIIRDSKGRFKKYTEKETLDQPKGAYKIIEATINFVPTKGGKIQVDDFEVLIRYPEGEYGKNDLEDMAIEALQNEGFPDYMVESCDIHLKTGKDFIGYSDNDKANYKIIDRTRPQYKYPKDKLWGELE